MPFFDYIQDFGWVPDGWTPAHNSHYRKGADFGAALRAFLESRHWRTRHEAWVRSADADMPLDRLRADLNGALDGPWRTYRQPGPHQYDLPHFAGQVDEALDVQLRPRADQQLQTEQQGRDDHWPLGVLDPPWHTALTTVPDFETYGKHPWANEHRGQLLTRHHAEAYLTFIASIVTPISQSLNTYVRRTTHFDKAASTLDLIEKVRARWEALEKADGAIDVTAAAWTNLTDLVQYWIENVPRMAYRRPVMDQVAALAPGAGNSQRMLRMICKGERDEIEALGKIVQNHQAGSYEKYKWFYYGGGNPGDGATHPYKVTVTVVAGARDALVGLAEDVREAARRASREHEPALISKENEHDCIGIHEDVLEAFSGLIQRCELGLK
ncbi:hypothetical protein AWN76_001530 [Rhodothermaceae bacterium RA]|nr:hypothetical protein AWN76_001530 [Rhodothermaceae bacterium RA]